MHSKLFNYLYKENPSDCIVCAIGPTLKFAAFFGTFSGSCNCIHMKSKKILKTEFKLSKVAVIYNQCLMLLILATIIWYFYLLSTQFNDRKYVVMELFAEICFCTGALIALLCHSVKSKSRIHELNAWVHILQSRCKYGISTLLDVKETRRIRVLAISHCLIVTVGILVFATYAFTRSYDEFCSWTTLRRPVAILAAFVQISTTINYNLEIIFIHSLFRNCHKSLKVEMTKHLDIADYVSKNSEFNNSFQLKGSHIEIKMQMTRRLHTAIYENYMYIADVLNTFFLWWFLLLILTIIFNCYIVVSVRNMGAYNTYIPVILLRTMTLISVMTCFLEIVEKAAHVVSTQVSGFN